MRVTVLPEAGPREMLRSSRVSKPRKVKSVAVKSLSSKRHWKSYYETTIENVKEDLSRVPTDSPPWHKKRAKLERLESEFHKLIRDYAINSKRAKREGQR